MLLPWLSFLRYFERRDDWLIFNSISEVKMNNPNPKSTKQDCNNSVMSVWSASGQPASVWWSAQGWNFYIAFSTSGPSNSGGMAQLCHCQGQWPLAQPDSYQRQVGLLRSVLVRPSLVRRRVSAWFPIMDDTRSTGKFLTSAEQHFPLLTDFSTHVFLYSSAFSL